MSAFENSRMAYEILKEAFSRIDPAQIGQLDMIYAYHFTDLDFYCTVVLKDGQVSVVEGLLTDTETTLEMDSEIFHQVMIGQMNVMYAHLSNRVRIAGSLGNVLKLRTIVRHLSDAYVNVLEEQRLDIDLDESEST